MSWLPAEEPQANMAPACRALETIVVPRPRDIGGFEVRRVLPSPERRNVGPFVFFDQMGPAELAPGFGIDVRPHPHNGLATVTYLFEGTIVHRDSLGSVQAIEPGAVNWMTAGRGIRVIAGSFFGKASPVKTFSNLFYADAAFDPGASLLLNNEYEERGIYLLEGDVDIHGQRFEPGRLLVFSSGDEITIKAVSVARLVLFGGEPLDGPRHVW